MALIFLKLCFIVESKNCLMSFSKFSNSPKSPNSSIITTTVSFKKNVGFPGDSDSKDSACNAGNGFNPWVGMIPWRKKYQSSPVFLPGKSHEQRSLAGYSPWVHKESDTTE